MIPFLIGNRIHFGAGSYHIILQLAHRLKLKRGFSPEEFAGFMERIFGSTFHRPAVVSEKRAEHYQRRLWRKRVHKSGGEPREHV